MSSPYPTGPSSTPGIGSPTSVGPSGSSGGSPAGYDPNQTASGGASTSVYDPYSLGDLANHSADIFLGTRPAYTQRGENGGSGVASPGSSEPVKLTPKELMDYLTQLAVQDPEKFDQYRAKLYNMGAYGSETAATAKKVQARGIGKWDFDAVKSALAGYYAATKNGATPETFDEFLDSAPGAKTDANGNAAYNDSAAAVKQVQLTDPAYLTMYAQKAAAAALGRQLTPAELNTFINNFHGEESQQQTDAQNGAPVVKSQDARAEAIQYAMQQPGYQSHQTAGYMDAFMNMFLPDQSKLPNVNVDTYGGVGY